MSIGKWDAPTRRARRWRKALGILGLIIFVLLGAVAARGRPANDVFYKSTGEVIGSLVTGAIIAFIFLFIVGTVGYGIARVRHRDRTWGDVTFGRAAMIVTLLLLVSSAAERATQHDEQVSKAKPNASGSLSEREKANLLARQWALSRSPLLSAFGTAVKQNKAFVAKLGAEGNTPSARSRARVIRRDFASVRARWAARPPTELADLHAVDADIGRAMQLAVDAYSDYLKGLSVNAGDGIPLNRDKDALALLDRGDVKLNHAIAMMVEMGRRLAGLDRKYGIR